MRRSSPGYYRRPRRGMALVNPLYCICRRTFGSSRELREHQKGCLHVRLENAKDTK